MGAQSVYSQVCITSIDMGMLSIPPGVMCSYTKVQHNETNTAAIVWGHQF